MVVVLLLLVPGDLAGGNGRLKLRVPVVVPCHARSWVEFIPAVTAVEQGAQRGISYDGALLRSTRAVEAIAFQHMLTNMCTQRRVCQNMARVCA